MLLISEIVWFVGSTLFLFVFGGLLMFFGLKVDLGISRRLNAKFKYEINPNKKLHEMPGKLVKKVHDKNPPGKTVISFRNYQRLNMTENKNLERYYLTFETFHGHKSFTVPEETFRKYKVNKYGIIRYQRSKFHSFSYRSKEVIMSMKKTT